MAGSKDSQPPIRTPERPVKAQKPGYEVWSLRPCILLTLQVVTAKRSILLCCQVIRQLAPDAGSCCAQEEPQGG